MWIILNFLKTSKGTVKLFIKFNDLKIQTQKFQKQQVFKKYFENKKNWFGDLKLIIIKLCSS